MEDVVEENQDVMNASIFCIISYLSTKSIKIMSH